MKIRQQKIALSFMVALCSPSALALVGGSGVDPNTAASPWASVGSVTIGGGVYSGVLLDSTHVLTAAHVVAGQVATAGNVNFSLNAGSNLTQTLGAASISVNPGFIDATPGADGVWHSDLAVITLSAPVTGAVPIYGLYSGNLDGQIITMVGYGGGGDGVAGVIDGSNASVKRVGENQVDVVMPNTTVAGAAFNDVFVFDFDGPTLASNVFSSPNPGTLGATTEAQYVGGDSGSPVFVSVNGVWEIAGIANFNGTTDQSPNSNVLFGSIGGGAILAPYIPWIESTLATPVPEPGAWAMLLAGLGMIGAAVRIRGRT